MVLQASHTRMDHVALTWANLYHIYDTVLPASGLVNLGTCDAITRSIEKRWKAADQPLFILAVIFNPYTRADAFHSCQGHLAAAPGHTDLFAVGRREEGLRLILRGKGQRYT